MGNIISKLTEIEAEREAARQEQENTAWLHNLAEQIINTNPTGPEFNSLKWLIDNREKITGNRKLIELLR